MELSGGTCLRGNVLQLDLDLSQVSALCSDARSHGFSTLCCSSSLGIQLIGTSSAHRSQSILFSATVLNREHSTCFFRSSVGLVVFLIRSLTGFALSWLKTSQRRLADLPQLIVWLRLRLTGRVTITTETSTNTCAQPLSNRKRNLILTPQNLTLILLLNSKQ